MSGEEHERQQQVFDGARIERSAFARGYFVCLQDGSHVGPFKQRDDAWGWIDRQTSRRHGR
jgi:hypothetical protein